MLLLALAGAGSAVLLLLLLVVAGLDLLALVLGAAIGAAALAAVVMLALRPVGRAQTKLGRALRSGERRERARHARTRRRIDSAELRLFSQLEALGWLRRMLPLEHGLPPTRRWAASPDLLVALVRSIDRSRPEVVLELGSGVSTIVLAARLRALGRGRLVSVEHDPAFAAQTRENLAIEGLADIATVLEAPLADIPIGERTWRWYDLSEAVLPERIDLLFVDGPPGATGALARYPALPVLAPRLARGAVIVVDDAHRHDEREMARRWLEEHPGLSLRELPSESGAFILRLPA